MKSLEAKGSPEGGFTYRLIPKESAARDTLAIAAKFWLRRLKPDDRRLVATRTQPPAERGPLSYTDKLLTCPDCARIFGYSASAQRLCQELGFTPPRLCPNCRLVLEDSRR